MQGARASEVRKLEAIAERACAALERHPPAALWKAVKGLELWIGAGWTDDGWAVEFRQPADVFADSDGFQSSLAGRTREARIVAFPVLAEVSIDEAVPLYMEAAVLDLQGAAEDGKRRQDDAEQQHFNQLPLERARRVNAAVGNDRHLAVVVEHPRQQIDADIGNLPRVADCLHHLGNTFAHRLLH